ncbi:MAG: 4Fe-4S dicluster domain-containing protein [Chloroflexi bacterium]|nr:4Fe-4S dicluster domain-containing protein [Chloroflexota bacterium]
MGSGLKLSRRDLLKWLGATGGAALIASRLPWLGGTEARAAADPEPTKSHRLRRWAMVINLRRCDGCIGLNLPPQCTQACILGHYVPHGMQWIQVFEYKFEMGGSYFMPTPCMQCENAPCNNVCPVGATFTTPEGVVLIDQKRCIGCRICMAACPYNRRFFNWGDPDLPPEALFAEYDIERQVPAIRGTVMKCGFCAHMARQGMVPFCVAGCPRRAIWYGDLEEDIATDTKEVVQFSRFLAENQAFRLKEELGTKPRVFYLPGYGQDVGRTPYQTGLRPVTWPWGSSQ